MILKIQSSFVYVVGLLPLLKYLNIYEITGTFKDTLVSMQKLRSFHEVAEGGHGRLFFIAHLVLQTVVLNENHFYKYVGSCKLAQPRSEKLFLEDTFSYVSIGNILNMTL